MIFLSRALTFLGNGILYKDYERIIRKIEIGLCLRNFTTSSKVFEFNRQYDVIVIGGGHAGSEACSASARMGANTLLITHKKSTIGEMSCNPSFGGIGKGHLIREVDALDGICGRICDLSGIHYKVLNKRKGPAVWGYRAQIDRYLYKQEMQKEIFNTPRLEVMEASVEDIILTSQKMTSADHLGQLEENCIGVMLSDEKEIYCRSLVLTTGTFLRGCINMGIDVQSAGRIGDKAAIGLARTLEKLCFNLGRLKTGTPPRIIKSTIDFSKCIPNLPDNPPRTFSFLNEKVKIKPEDQLSCYLTHTTKGVNEIVTKTLHLNRHVKEEVNGPRYCPSIESKVLRYPYKQHQIWLEPEGLESQLIYPQGLSCTMPLEYQQSLLRHIPGLEACEIAQPGYGVEYDFVNPQELTPELETIKIKGLFFAGQINGTTGYEEAAAQGIVAGINAAAKALGKPEFSVNRSEAYIGVLIDDLTSLGTSEPYRMFTSRSEFRIRLRPDNADIRLTEKAYEAGCVSEKRYLKTKNIRSKLEHWIGIMKDDKRKFQEWSNLLGQYCSPSSSGFKSTYDILGLVNWEVTAEDLAKKDPLYKDLLAEEELWERLKIQSLYAQAVLLEQNRFDNVRLDYSLELPSSLDYYSHSLNISNEIREKLTRIRPKTIGSASLIPGVTPSAVSTLLSYVKVKHKKYATLLV